MSDKEFNTEALKIIEDLSIEQLSDIVQDFLNKTKI